MNTELKEPAVLLAALLRRVFFVWGLGTLAAYLTAAEITVTTPVELEGALASALPGDEILVRAGVYPIAQALRVPDGVTLLGDGVMLFDVQGMPAGFALEGQTILQAESTLMGDMITLGNGAILGALILRDASRTGGNVVAVSSRGPGDTISTSILECEIFNPNGSGIGPQGPTGRSLAVITRNPNMAAPPSPDDDASVHVRVRHSIVHAPIATAVFANNFASRCAITLSLTENVVGGLVDIVGGTSRPDAVTDSSVTLVSRGNRYYSENSVVPGPIGWSIIGGAAPPLPIVTGISTRNAVRVLSFYDRIEGFASALVATGGQRYFPNSGPVVSNHVDLFLHGIRLQSTLGDLSLTGGRSNFDGNVSDAPGNNSLHLLMTHAVGSGVRQNIYADQLGIWPGNHLKILGSPTSFGRLNDAIAPPPPAKFFSSHR